MAAGGSALTVHQGKEGSTPLHLRSTPRSSSGYRKKWKECKLKFSDWEGADRLSAAPVVQLSFITNS